MDYICTKMSFDRYNIRTSIEEAERSRNWKKLKKKARNKIKDGTSETSPKNDVL